MAVAGVAAVAAAIGQSAAAGWVISAAIAAVATYASQSMARRQAEKAERAAGVQGPSLASFRSSSAPRQIIYGKCRTGGPVAYVGTTSDSKNNHLCVDVMLAGHECTAIDEVWLDEYRVTLTGPVNRNFDGRSYYVWQNSGSPDDPATTVEVVDYPGTATSLYTDAVGGRYNVRNGVELFFCELSNLGTANQAVSPLMFATTNGQWRESHRLRGICHVPMGFAWAPDAFQSGPPNATFVVRGKKVYDPRTETTGYSNNSALCLLDYLLDTRLGLGASLSEIDTASFIAAADICDQSVTKADGSTEARYTTNGVLLTDATHEDNILSLLSAMDGKLVYSGGYFRLYAGASLASAATFTEDDLRGPITIQTQQERSKIVNAVRGTFSAPENNWQPTDYPPVTSATYYAADQNEWIWMDLPQPMTTSAATAQRLAKIAMERSRRQIVVQLPAKLTALKVLPGETIALTFSRYGWTAKTFTVDELRLVTEEDDNGQPRYGVDLVLREVDANIWTWTTANEEQLPPAPTTTLPNPFTVLPPSSLDVAEALFVARAPVVQSKVTVSLGPSQDRFVTSYRVRYRSVAASEWAYLPAFTGPATEVVGLAPGSYIFSAAAVNVYANESPYIERRVSLSGLSAPPVALDDLTIQTAGGLAILTWTQSEDQDVFWGGWIEIRHSNATSGASWTTASPIGAPYPGSAALAVLPLKAGTYLVRPYDSSGMAGPTSSVVTDGATALTYTSLTTLTEDTAFSGSKTNCVVASSKLKLDASGNIDSATDFDAILDMDGLGGIYPTGSYAFATTMDLGAVKRVRLAGRIVVQVFAVLDRVDSRNPNMDDWYTFDGTDGSECEAWIEARHSANNSTWSDWQRCDATEGNDRYWQFRCQLRSNNADYNIEVSELRASASEI
jgi:type II secretory pathway pseudopilin PulG